jgi:serine/threonine protein kinase
MVVQHVFLRVYHGKAVSKLLLLLPLIREKVRFQEMLNASEDLRVGGKYRLLRKIGEGGYGLVYLGWNHNQYTLFIMLIICKE